MHTTELFRTLQKAKFFRKYGNKAVMACGRIVADIIVNFEGIGTVIISMLNDSTLELRFSNNSCAFDETHQVASVDDVIDKVTNLINSPNIRH